MTKWPKFIPLFQTKTAPPSLAPHNWKVCIREYSLGRDIIRVKTEWICLLCQCSDTSQEIKYLQLRKETEFNIVRWGFCQLLMKTGLLKPFHAKRPFTFSFLVRALYSEYPCRNLWHFPQTHFVLFVYMYPPNECAITASHAWTLHCFHID